MAYHALLLLFLFLFLRNLWVDDDGGFDCLPHQLRRSHSRNHRTVLPLLAAPLCPQWLFPLFAASFLAVFSFQNEGSLVRLSGTDP